MKRSIWQRFLNLLARYEDATAKHGCMLYVNLTTIYLLPRLSVRHYHYVPVESRMLNEADKAKYELRIRELTVHFLIFHLNYHRIRD